MAFRALVVATLVAYASAGMNVDMMQMMQMMQNMKGWGNNMGGGNMAGGNMGGNMGGNLPQPQAGGCRDGKCNIPAGVDIDAYMEQQKREQKFEQEQMAAKIKAQFESVMAEVTMKKHRYAMGIMTEFTSMCACLKSSYDTYQSMFVQNARAANMTDIVDLDDYMNKLPYQAATLKEAKERIFAGMLNSMCTSLGNFMDFAEQVEQQLQILNPTQG